MTGWVTDYMATEPIIFTYDEKARHLVHQDSREKESDKHKYIDGRPIYIRWWIILPSYISCDARRSLFRDPFHDRHSHTIPYIPSTTSFLTSYHHHYPIVVYMIDLGAEEGRRRREMKIEISQRFFHYIICSGYMYINIYITTLNMCIYRFSKNIKRENADFAFAHPSYE